MGSRRVDKYHVSLRMLHWLVGISIIGMIISGIYMTELDDSDYKYGIYDIHKEVGFTVLVAMFIRLAVRLYTTIPQHLSKTSTFERRASSSVHFLLYAGTFTVALSGYLMQGPSGRQTPWFFDTTVPNLLDKDEQLAELLHTVHVNAPYFLIALISFHILGFIKHALAGRAFEVWRRIF